MGRTLVITNDFPPRPGGIQTFGFEMVRRFDPASVTVLTSTWDECEKFDAAQSFEIVRASTQTLLPTRKTLHLARQLVLSGNVTRVLFGAAAPLGLLARPLRELGVEHIVGMTQGHETGWAMTPGTRQALRKIGNDVDTLTYISGYTKSKIRKALSPEAATKMRAVVPGVDVTEFNPRNKVEGKLLREQIGLGNRPVIVCVSRLMARKGQDTLIEALPEIAKAIPNVALIIVGDGPYRPDLEKMVSRLNLSGDVHFTGKVDQEKLAHWYAAGDVFAMPCRTRMGGWDVEGLGIVFLEGSATGLPVVVGDSGGAVDAVQDGVTGFLVDGKSQEAVVSRIIKILSDADLAKQLGAAGRDWVTQSWTWDHSFARLNSLLHGQDPDALA
ncbi:MAG: glycosyltransferase family 4 protein [Actinomycetes bacterium]